LASAVFASRVENGRGGFRFSVAMAILSNCRLSPTYHDSVSHLRSSNRTCGIAASGFPTDFTLKLTTAGTYYWIPRVDTLCLLRLRLKVELHLKFPDVLWCLQAHRQSPLLLSFRSVSEVRAFPPSRFRDFSGTMPLSDSRPYQHPKCCGESLPHVRDGSPTLHKALSRHAILITPVDQNRCTYIGFFSCPAAASPNIGRVGFHIFTFEACSRFTRVTACRFAATLLVYLCLQSFSRTSPCPSVWIATELNR